MTPLETLLESVGQREGGSDRINPFWMEQLRKFRVLLETTRKPSIDQLRSALGYNDERLPRGVQSNRALPDWPELERLSAQREATGLPKAVQEHVGALVTLRAHGVLDQYLAVVDQMGVRSSMTTARHFWYARRVSKYITPKRPLNVLEIGAGAGQFMTLLAKAGLVRNYVIVDLPAMLINACVNAEERLAGFSIKVNELPNLRAADCNILLVEADRTSILGPDVFDLAVNFNSFMEMDKNVRDEYIRLIYATLRDHGIFYNVNRRQSTMTMKNGEPFDNHPLLYPYLSTDNVLEWETDEFQQNYRSRDYWSAQKSFAISRIATVRKPAMQ